MRKIISEYLYNIYNTENISTNDGHNIYTVDEFYSGIKIMFNYGQLESYEPLINPYLDATTQR